MLAQALGFTIWAIRRQAMREGRNCNAVYEAYLLGYAADQPAKIDNDKIAAFVQSGEAEDRLFAGELDSSIFKSLAHSIRDLKDFEQYYTKRRKLVSRGRRELMTRPRHRHGL